MFSSITESLIVEVINVIWILCFMSTLRSLKSTQKAFAFLLNEDWNTRSGSTWVIFYELFAFLLSLHDSRWFEYRLLLLWPIAVQFLIRLRLNHKSLNFFSRVSFFLLLTQRCTCIFHLLEFEIFPDIISCFIVWKQIFVDVLEMRNIWNVSKHQWWL